MARNFVNNTTGQRGLACQYEVTCFADVSSGVYFDKKDSVNIMKGHM